MAAPKKQQTAQTIIVERKNPWTTTIMILIVLFLISLFLAGLVGLFINPIQTGNVAVIPISGTITIGGNSGIFGNAGTSSTDTVAFIEKADKNPNIKAIVLEINSGGGSAVASEEIVRALKKTNKTTVAWIREAGASGAYWSASATDHIIASPISIVGSIGATSSYIEISQFLIDHNVTYNRLVSGDLKDMGSPYKELDSKERQLFQSMLDDIKDYFVEDVAKNRNLSKEYVNNLATGEVFLGKKAKDLGLVDELGSRDELIMYLKNQTGEEPEFTVYAKEPGFFDSLFQNKFNFNFGADTGLNVRT